MKQEQIGTYRILLWTDDKTHVYHNAPIYGIRDVGLTSIKRTVRQVLTNSIGGLAWININPHDVVLDNNQTYDTLCQEPTPNPDLDLCKAILDILKTPTHENHYN